MPTNPNRYEIRNVLEGITNRADHLSLAKQIAVNDQQAKKIDIYVFDTQAKEGRVDLLCLRKTTGRWEKLHRKEGLTHSPSVLLDLIGGMSPLPHAN